MVDKHEFENSKMIALLLFQASYSNFIFEVKLTYNSCFLTLKGKCQGTRVENVALPEIQLDKSSRVSGKRKKTKDQVVKKNKKKKRKTKKNTKK